MLDFEVEAENDIKVSVAIGHIVANELKHYYPSFPFPFTDKALSSLIAAAVETVHPDWEQFPDLVRLETKARFEFVRHWLADQGLLSFKSVGLYKVESTVLNIEPPATAPNDIVGVTSEAPKITEIGGMLDARELADKHEVDYDALRKRLSRWQQKSQKGWQETTESNRGPRDPKYVYDERMVLPIIESLKSTGV